MDDRQLYKDTFDQVRSSVVISEEMFTMNPKRRPLRTVAILVAVVCLILACGVTAVATNLFGLRDLVITPDAVVGPENDPTPGTVELISMQGYSDSPEYLAAQEWQAFYDSYVPTLELDNSIFGENTPYINYGVYDQTMADKLDEILAKYGLKLYDHMTDLDSKTALNTVMGGDFLLGNNRFTWGYRFDDGTLQFEGDCTVTGVIPVDYQFRRSQKGSFSDVVLNIGHAADYAQWQYETSGVAVTLALGPTKSLIFADLPDCFVCVNVLAGTDGGLFYDELSVTESDLEALADRFDWALCGGMPQAPEDIPEYDEEDVQPPSDDFYNVATKFPAYAVEGFASTVRGHILDKNWESLGELLVYPINIESKTYNSAEEFAAEDWARILSDDFFQAIEDETCRRMFSSADGIMMADGLVWIAQVHDGDDMLKVVTMNTW